MSEQDGAEGISRREALTLGTATLAALFVSACTGESIEAFFQKRFNELSPDEVKRVLARLEARYTAALRQDDHRR